MLSQQNLAVKSYVLPLRDNSLFSRRLMKENRIQTDLQKTLSGGKILKDYFRQYPLYVNKMNMSEMG